MVEIAPETASAHRLDTQVGFEELRLATVMTGGVSLAVWMGGVTAELGRLLNHVPGYVELEDALRTRCTLDVVSGTSAGGVNGVVLALAQVREADIAVLRDVWLQEASLTDLMRSPREKDPLSLLHGDDTFLPALDKAFRQLASSPAAPTPVDRLSSDARQRLKLFVTATLLQGESRSTTDDFGTVVQDVDHKALFSFSYDDLRSDRVIPALALAARTTASFPGAFEASYVPVERDPRRSGDGRLNMSRYVDATISRFAVDGGVLVNKPLRPAIEAIFRAPASQPVRRVLAYVVPDPGVSTYGEADRPDQPPPLQDVLMRSLLDIPHVQSVAADLAQINNHNEQVRAQREARAHLLRLLHARPLDDPVDDSAKSSYCLLRAEDETRQLLSEVTRQMNGRLARKDLPDEWKTQLQFNSAAFARRESMVRDLLLRSIPQPPGPMAAMSGDDVDAVLVALGRPSLDRAAAVCLDLVGRSFALVSGPMPASLTAGRPGDPRAVAWQDLCAAGSEIHRVGRLLQPAPDARDVVSEWMEQVPYLDTDSGLTPADWLTSLVHGWRRRNDLTSAEQTESPDRGADRLHNAADGWRLLVAPLVERAGFFRGLADSADVADGSYGDLCRYLLGEAGEVEPSAVIMRLLRLEVYQRVLAVRAPVTEQETQFIQISADTRSLLHDGRKLASDKLTGLQLHHFGAFYKRSWRANDWMWGRIDGAGWLVHLLLSPQRIRALQEQSGEAADTWCLRFLSELKGISRAGTADVTTVVDGLWSGRGSDDGRLSREQVAVEELCSVFQLRADYSGRPAGQPPNLVPDSAIVVPAALPNLSLLVASGLQVGIVLEELPNLRQQLDLDAELGADRRKNATFRADYDRVLRRAGVLDAASAVMLLQRCTVPDETLDDEFGTDLMTYTAATAAATGVSAAGGVLRKAPVAFQPGVAVVRLATLGVYGLARMALHRSKTAFATLCLLVLVGVLGVALVEEGTWGRRAAAAMLVVVGLYVALRMPRSVRDAVKIVVVLLLVLVAVVVGLFPSELPTPLRDWPQDLLDWLAVDGGRRLRWGVVAVALLAVAWAGDRWLSRRRRTAQRARGVREARRARRAGGSTPQMTPAGAGEPGRVTQSAAPVRNLGHRVRTAAGAFALRRATRWGAVATPRVVDGDQFQSRLSAYRSRSTAARVRRVLAEFTERGAEVEFAGTPAQPVARVVWPASGDTPAGRATPAVAVHSDARLVLSRLNAELTASSVVRDLLTRFEAHQEGGEILVPLTDLDEATARALVDDVVRLVRPGAAQRP